MDRFRDFLAGQLMALGVWIIRVAAWMSSYELNVIHDEISKKDEDDSSETEEN